MTSQAEFITLARETRLDEPYEGFFLDRDIRQWINEAAKDIARKSNSLMGSESVNTTGGSTTPLTLTTNDNVHKLHVCTWQADNDTQIWPIEPVDYNYAQEVWGPWRDIHQSYKPDLFTAKKSGRNIQIILYPIPSDDGTLVVYYYKLPTDLAVVDNINANSEVEVVSGWEDLVLDYIAFRGKRKARDQDWVADKQIYEDNLMALVDTSIRQVDAVGQYGGVGPYSGVPAWLVGDSEGY